MTDNAGVWPNLVEPAWPNAPQGAARAGETRGAAAATRMLSDAAATPARGQGRPRAMSVNKGKCLIYIRILKYINFEKY